MSNFLLYEIRNPALSRLWNSSFLNFLPIHLGKELNIIGFVSNYQLNAYFLYSITTYRVPQKEWTKLRESVSCVKIYRYNSEHLCPKLNGYGYKGQRKVWFFCRSTYCTWFA